MICVRSRLAILKFACWEGFAARLTVWSGSSCICVSLGFLLYFAYCQLEIVGAYLEVVEFLFIGAPDGIVQTVVVGDETNALVCVVLVAVANLAESIA